MTVTLLDFLLGLYFFVLGAVIASFLCALVYRMEKMRSWRKIFSSRSVCESCGKKLKWYELFPVFSWIFLRGKCSKCGKKISPLYPIIELFLGLTFLLFYLNGLSWYLFVVAVLLAFVSIYDLIYMEVPQTVFIVYFVIAIPFFIVQLLSGNASLFTLLEAFGVTAIILVLNLIKKSFGVADILAIIFLGFIVSQWQVLKLAYASVVIGAIVGVYLIVIAKKSPKTYIPFLPFIYLGFVFTVGFLL